MSQTSSQPPQVCAQCQNLIQPGQRFCSNCGMVAQISFPPTAAASLFPNQIALSNPSTNPPLYPNALSQANPSTNPSPNPYRTSAARPNFPLSGFTQPEIQAVSYTQPVSSPSYMQTDAPPPPPYAPVTPPSDPYGSAPLHPYGSPPPILPYPAPVQPKKRSPLAAIIIGLIVLILLACGGGSLVLIKALGSSAPGGASVLGNSAPSTQNINLSITYASDQITFTSMQQASSFSDDSYTSFYTKKPNYVRLNFKEQQTASQSSFFSYREAVHLILPDKSVIAPENEQNYSGPDQAVVRTNWIDFATPAQVDLSQLILRLGADDEAPMEFPLKTGADVSKYQPQTTNLNKPFHYAGLNWSLKSVTQSLYANGTQAKTGKIYVSVVLTTDNPTDNEVFLGDVLRLKSGSTVTSPEYTSDSEAIKIIKPNTTNLQGTVLFLVPPSTSYTLDMLANSDSYNPVSEQTVEFQVS